MHPCKAYTYFTMQMMYSTRPLRRFMENMYGISCAVGMLIGT